MPTRLLLLGFLLIGLPALSQQAPPIQRQIQQRVDQREDRISRVIAEPAVNEQAAKMLVVRQDANELLALSASVQSDLQRLQQGVLVKDLNNNLKKMGKLSKKLRQEIE